MKINDLLEARRNPNHPAQKETRKSKIDLINKYRGKDGYFVSFQQLPKLGYNPSMIHGGTPAGIYAYPLLHFDDVVDTDTISDVFPYGSDRPYTYIFKARGNVLYLDSYSKSQLKVDIQKLLDLKLLPDESVNLAIDRIKNIGHQNISKIGIYYGGDKFNTGVPCVTFWVATYLAAQNGFQKDSKVFPFKWANVIKKLGYDVIVDDYGGVIYGEEPFQAVFLTPSSIEMVDSWKKMVKDFDDLEFTDIEDSIMKRMRPSEKRLVNSFLSGSNEEKANLIAASSKIFSPYIRNLINIASDDVVIAAIRLRLNDTIKPKGDTPISKFRAGASKPIFYIVGNLTEDRMFRIFKEVDIAKHIGSNFYNYDMATEFSDEFWLKVFKTYPHMIDKNFKYSTKQLKVLKNFLGEEKYKEVFG